MKLHNIRFKYERGLRSGRNRETETKDCGRHVQVMSETAIGHCEKRNQLSKRTQSFATDFCFSIRLRYIGNGVVERKLNEFLIVSIIM